MAPYVPEPRDRLDAPICREIEGKNWKQALKLVDKRLVKDKSLWNECLKCYIQCNHLSYTERMKGVAYILQLSASPAKIFQEDELELLDEAAAKVVMGKRASRKSDAVCQARAAAVKAKPKDEKFALACLRACMKVNNLAIAMEIIPIMERNFPEKRQYAFWSIVIGYLYAISSEAPDSDGTNIKNKKGLFLALAHSKLKLFAAATQKASKDGTTLPPKSLQNSQELLLLYKVSNQVGSTNQLEDHFVLDSAVGADSPIGKGEWVLQLERLKFLILKEDWNALYKVSSNMLVRSRASGPSGKIEDARGADWQVWNAFLLSAKHAKGGTSSAREEINYHLSSASGLDKAYKRNAQLASLEWEFAVCRPALSNSVMQLEYLRLEGETAELSKLATPRVFQLVEFLHDNAHATSAFGDVKPYVEMLSYDEQASLFDLALPLLGIPKAALRLSRHGKEYRVGKKTERTDVQDLVDHKSVDGDEMNVIHTKINSMTALITALKLAYLCVSSSAEQVRESILASTGKEKLRCVWCAKECKIFCGRCLEWITDMSLYYYEHFSGANEQLKKFLLPTDRHPADGFAIISTMAIIKLAKMAKYKLALSPATIWDPEEMELYTCAEHSQRLLQAAALLDHAHQKSLPNPDITLLLEQVYYQLGCGSLAMETFRELNLKQVQNHTLGYILFDRIATLHPRPQPGGSSTQQKPVDPAKDLERLHDFYRKSKVQTQNQIWKSLEHGSYDSVLQLMDFNATISATRTAALSAVESRRLHRLLSPHFELSQDSHGFDLIPDDMSEAVHSTSINTFDYNSFPDFEHTDAKPFRDFVAPGPDLNQHRIAGYFYAERMHELAACSVKDDKDSYMDCLHRLSEAFQKDSDGSIFLNSLDNHCDTIPELQYISLVSNMVEIVLLVVDPVIPYDEERASVLIKEANQYLTRLVVLGNPQVDPSEKTLPLFSTTLHPIYVLQESELLLAAISRFLILPGKSQVKKIASKSIQQVAALARQANGLAHKGAKAAKDRMDESGWLDDILSKVMGVEHDMLKKDEDRGIGEVMTDMIGSDELESWASRLLDSYHDSVEGMVKVCKPVELT